jgi:hypothetical protein
MRVERVAFEQATADGCTRIRVEVRLEGRQETAEMCLERLRIFVAAELEKSMAQMGD